MGCSNASEPALLKNSKRTMAEKVFLAFHWLVAVILSGLVSVTTLALTVLKIEISICTLVTIKKRTYPGE